MSAVIVFQVTLFNNLKKTAVSGSLQVNSISGYQSTMNTEKQFKQIR